jgi:VIT1/CCC1 family predicted Fe2+/Mn2+ transporter
MPITGTKQIIEELESLRSEIASVRREVRVLAKLTGVEDQWVEELLRLQAEDDQRQARIKQFLDAPDQHQSVLCADVVID